MSVYELRIDGSAAEAGSQRVVKSFAEIRKAAEAMESGAKASFSRMAEAYKQLSNMGSIKGSTLNSFKEFSAAISGFKGPSQANLANTKKFFTYLDTINGKKYSMTGLKSFIDTMTGFRGPSSSAAASVRTLLKAAESFGGVRGAGLKEFLDTLTGFKGPSQASAKNVSTLLKALSSYTPAKPGGLASFLSTLSGYTGPSQASAKNTATLLRALSGFSAVKVPASFSTFLTALGAYRGPSANAGRNTLSLLQALATFTPPRNMGTTVADFTKLAQAIDLAANSMTRLRQQARGGINVPNLGRAGAGVRGLGNSFGFLETTILRTQTALNAIGGVLGVKFIADASNAIVKIKSQLEAATGSVQQARVQFEFLREQSNKMGLEFTTVAKSYGMLLGSIKGTNVTFAEAQRIFLGFSTAARALQLSTEDVDGVFRALGQIMSKGKLQAEELRGQLGDRLPGAFVRFAVALKMTKPGELDDALKKGAISGDKLKNAILAVADTMQNEFAASADKASKTVDAAFNRLKNSFTFSSAEFGQNGFNQALISMADSLRKLLDSRALNTAMKGLAGVLKLLGDNIETVATIAIGIGVTSFAKWAIAITAANTAVAGFMRIMAAGRIIAMALALGQAGRAAKVLMLALNANVFGLVAVAIMGVVYALNHMSTAQSKANDTIAQHTSDTAELTNMYDAYIAKMWSATDTTNAETDAIRRRTLARLEDAKAALGGATPIRFNSRKDSWGAFSDDAGTVGAAIDWWKGDVANKDERRLLGPIMNRAGVGSKVYTDDDAIARIKSIGNIRAEMAGKPLSDAGEGLIKQVEADLNIYRQVQRLKGNTKFEERLTGEFGDYNRSTMPPGISGDVPEKAKKDKGAKTFENDVDRAIRAFAELDRKIQGSRDALEGFLQSSSNAIAAQARAGAIDKVADLENAFDPKKRVAGVLAVAKAMGLEAKSYDSAKAALVGKYAAQLELEARVNNDLEAGKTVASLREENAIRSKHLELVAMGGRAASDAAIAMEVEKQLIGGTADQRARLTQELTNQMKVQRELNQAEEVAKTIGDARASLKTNQATEKMFGGGFLPDEISQYQDLMGKIADLKKQGYDAGTEKYLTDLAKATAAQQRALNIVQDEYEEIRQYSQDIADSLTDGLRNLFEGAGQAGENFGDKIKAVFKSLSDTVLNFTLYEPLRNFLADSLTRQNTKGMAGSRSVEKLRDANQNLSDVLDAGQDLVNSMMNKISTEVLDRAGENLNEAARAQTAAADRISTAADQFVAAFNLAIPVGQALNTDQARGITGGGQDNPLNLAPAAVAMMAMPSVTQAMGKAVQEVAPDQQDITVTGSYGVRTPNPERQERDYFRNLRSVFDFKSNNATLKTGFGDIKKAFSGETKGFTAKMDSVGKGISGVMKVAGKAFAAYEMGSGVGKALGMGNVGQKTLGGASAGFAIGGPIGGAIGAGIGLIAGLMTNKNPRARADVIVGGAGGRAEAGNIYAKDGGNKEGVTSMASASAGSFGTLASQLGSYLSAGNYGTFGEVQIKNSPNKFYSVTGQTNKKGQPTGTRGVDWIASDSEDELQAFALRSQIKAGKFMDLDPIYKQIANASSAKTTSDFTSDLNVGKSFLDFIDSAKIGSDMQKQMDDLKKNFDSLKRSSAALGLETGKLDLAYNKMIKTQRESFNYDINQQILQIKDPLMAAYNDMMKEYEKAVGNAVAVGGDLVKVEELFGLKRTEVLEQFANSGVNAIKVAAKDMLTSLTSTTQSPLSAFTTFGNAQTDYKTLVAELQSGNYKNIDKLQSYSQNYLDTARATSRSSADYFDVFNEVTDFLKLLSEKGLSTSGTAAGDLPELPGVSVIVDKLSKQNDDLLGVQKSIGATIAEGNSTSEELLRQILEALRANPEGLSSDVLRPSLLSPGALAGYKMSTTGA